MESGNMESQRLDPNLAPRFHSGAPLLIGANKGTLYLIGWLSKSHFCFPDFISQSLLLPGRLATVPLVPGLLATPPCENLRLLLLLNNQLWWLLPDQEPSAPPVLDQLRRLPGLVSLIS
jgi:hypothetical protein